MNAFPPFTTPQLRRPVELRRVASADARLAAARRAAREAQEIYASELVDQYAATLFRLAWVVSADLAIASCAVRVIVAASMDHARLEPSRPLLAELSRLTMWASPAPVAAPGVSSSGPRDL